MCGTLSLKYQNQSSYLNVIFENYNDLDGLEPSQTYITIFLKSGGTTFNKQISWNWNSNSIKHGFNMNVSADLR